VKNELDIDSLRVIEPSAATLQCTTNGRHERPELVVQDDDLPTTARALRDLLSTSPDLFVRGVPVKLVPPTNGYPPIAMPLRVNDIVVQVHALSRPVRLNSSGKLKPVTLPDRLARMYLDMTGDWHLRPLAGISPAPVLEATGLYCSSPSLLGLPDRPTRAEAESAFRLLRETFRTFPFADGERDNTSGGDVIDINKPPARDESAFHVGLLTAVCRPTLQLAPGFLLNSAPISGAGTGKGLLVRAISAIAYGVRPRAFTSGNDRNELDKRLAAELIEAAPALFLDNVNNTTLRSDTLASILTERPARVRLLGATRMVLLNSASFIAITGNGLAISEDLARRFVMCELDARCEDAETRPFDPGFLELIEQKRCGLLAAALTIWRWGRQNVSVLTRGRSLGSFETWCSWVRDPLVTLGCADPVERIQITKANDPRRQRIAAAYTIWWQHHADKPLKAGELHDAVQVALRPHGRGRQYLVAFLGGLVGTRVGGFVLEREKPAGKWGTATYALKRTAKA
jgi:hypothetical protein